MGRKPKEQKEEYPNIIRDMVGEKTDLSLCPECPFGATHPDCFAGINGRCTALRKVDESAGCAFYKSREQYLAEVKKSYEHLKEAGRSDLIVKYIKSLSAMGMLDDEILEAEQYGEEFETFRETDYQAQLEKALEDDDFDDLLNDDADTDADGDEDEDEDGDEDEDEDGDADVGADGDADDDAVADADDGEDVDADDGADEDADDGADEDADEENEGECRDGYIGQEVDQEEEDGDNSWDDVGP